jgi:hypothetical protein
MLKNIANLNTRALEGKTAHRLKIEVFKIRNCFPL